MPVSFNNIPSNIRVPLFYAEVNAGGTPYQSISRLLLVGQMTAAGSAAPGVPVIVGSANEAALFGAGSQVAEMVSIARRNAPFQEIWALPLADPSGSAAAAGTITVSGAPVAAGVLTLYVAGTRVQVPVAAADEDEDIAAAIAAAINAAGLCVAAVVDGEDAEQINISARNKGALGNEIQIDTDLIGDESGLAAELLTITALSAGDGEPDLAAAFATLGDDEYDWIAAPYASTSALNAVRDLLGDVSGRWSPMQQLYGHYITAKSGELGTLSALGEGRNDPHVSIMGTKVSPSPVWRWAAAVAAKAAQHLSDGATGEIARPLQTLALQGILPPKLPGNRFTIQERQTLYYDGISGYHVRRDGQVAIDRVITTYRLNAWGQPDATFLDIETIAQMVYAIRYLRQKVTNAHGRQALADDNPVNSQAIATVDSVRATIVHGYRELERLAVVENSELFADQLIVERNAVDVNRIDAYLPIDTVNQLRIVAVNATTFLQYPAEG